MMGAEPVRVFTVLRSGGDFEIGHVLRLWGQMVRRSTYLSFRCLTDVENDIRQFRPLLRDWPGWWAKLEICRPDIGGPILFVDLDTVIVGDLAPLVADTSRSIVLRDFYRAGDSVQSALMLLTEDDRDEVWRTFIADPENWIASQRSDQNVFERVLRDRALRWQDTHPGMVLGYKTDMVGMAEPPEDCRIVCFHGQPRPWDTEHAWAR